MQGTSGPQAQIGSHQAIENGKTSKKKKNIKSKQERKSTCYQYRPLVPKPFQVGDCQPWPWRNSRRIKEKGFGGWKIKHIIFKNKSGSYVRKNKKVVEEKASALP